MLRRSRAAHLRAGDGAVVIPFTRRAADEMRERLTLRPRRRWGTRELSAMVEGSRRVALDEARTERAEAELVVHTIERWIGGSTFLSMDSGRVGAAETDHRLLLERSLAFEVDAWAPRAERISLLTRHAAKGLEFRVVFLIGCEDGLLPLRFPGKEATDVDEERRLFYVGMTRARERLSLTHARERMRHGKPVERPLSPFVREVEEGLLERRDAAMSRRAAPVADRQLKLF